MDYDSDRGEDLAIGNSDIGLGHAASIDHTKRVSSENATRPVAFLVNTTRLPDWLALLSFFIAVATLYSAVSPIITSSQYVRASP